MNRSRSIVLAMCMLAVAIAGREHLVYAVNGRARIPARFAVDFVRLHGDGTHAQGDR